MSEGPSPGDPPSPAELDDEAPDPGLSAKGPLAWMANNSVAANLLMIVLMVGGLLSVGRIRQEVFPEFELDLVVIAVPYPGASPEEVEQGVILAVEESVRAVDGVQEVRSSAREGMGTVTLELILGADADRALADVKSAVDRIVSFPQDVERPVVSRPQLRSEAISVIVYGETSEANLRSYADRVRDDLLRDPGITTVELSGVRPLEVSVEIPQENVRRFGLTHGDVARAIGNASVELPAGGLRTERGEVLLRTRERRDRGTEFEDIVVLSRPDGTEVRVRDLGTVVDGFQEQDVAAAYEGHPAVMVKVYRVGNQTPLDIAESVHRYVEENRDALPEGMGLAIWNDRAELYRDRVNLLVKNAGMGLVLVLLCLGLFLEIKLAFWVTLGIPICFIGSLLFLPQADVSLNMISLFAFILTLGMVVDDAIVVGEAVYKKRTDGLPFMQAAIEGTREVATPVVFAILTTCLAFAPLLFVPGVMGKFFQQIPIVVIVVLALSLVESLLILPAHLGHSSRGHGKVYGWVHRQQQRFSRGLEWLITRTYVPSLDFALRHRYLTLAFSVSILIASAGLVAGGRLEFTFFPKIDSDVVAAQLTMPFGTAAEETVEIQSRILTASDEVLEELAPGQEVSRGRFSLLGGMGSAGGGPAPEASSDGSHVAEVAIQLRPSDERPFTAREFAERWRERVGEIPGVETLVFKYSTGAGGGPPIDFQLSHNNLDTLERAAVQLAEGLREYAGVQDIDTGFNVGKEQIDLRLRPEARSHGITETLLARQVRESFFGAEAARQQRGRDELRIFVRRPLDERSSLADFEQMLVRTPEGGEIPLLEAAEVSFGRSYTEIRRLDGRRRVNVTADVVLGTNANRVQTGVQENVVPRLLEAFPGLTVRPGGEQQRQADTMEALRRGFMLALLAMFALMAVAFKSYVQPAIVITAIPFGFVGAALGHLLVGYDLSLMSMMGLVALSGVAVNDSLVLVSAVNDYRRDGGMSIGEAVRAGGARRFRPILLTSLTTFLGLTPMILETSVGARFLIPMAVSLGFGVLFATFIILVLVPCLYLMIEDGTRVADWVRGKRATPTLTPSEVDGETPVTFE